MYESAVDAYNKGDYDQAIEIYKAINKEAPQFAPAYIGIGLSMKAKGAEAEEVLYYYKLAVDKDPSNVQILDQLGRLYYSLGQMDKAKNIFEKALKINPDLSEIKLTLAWIYITGKKINTQLAIKYFRDVVSKTSAPNAYFGLGMAYLADNQRTKVLDIITELKMTGQDDLAAKLEKAVRENRRIVADSSESDENREDNPKNPNDIEKTSDSPKGIKVRLRGKLDEL